VVLDLASTLPRASRYSSRPISPFLMISSPGPTCFGFSAMMTCSRKTMSASLKSGTLRITSSVTTSCQRRPSFAISSAAALGPQLLRA